MSAADLFDRAERAVRDAFKPGEFDARPMYGIGYIPAGQEPEVAAPGNFASWKDTRLAWAAVFAALALAGAIDLFVQSRRDSS